MGSKANTIGLDKQRIEEDWPALTADEVHALLARYSWATGPLTMEWKSPRPLSAAAVVRVGDRRVFIKRHHTKVRTAEGLREEHGFLAHLRMRGAPVVEVLADDTGETAHAVDAWSYEVQEVPAAVDVYAEVQSWRPYLRVEHARAAGAALATLHCAAEGYDAPRRRVQPLVASLSIFATHDARAAMAEYLAARPALDRDARTRDCCSEAMELLAPFHAELEPLLGDLKPLWTHNDLHGSNILWSNGGARAEARAVVDFNLADRTNAVHDVAQAIERGMVEWMEMTPRSHERDDVPIHLEQLAALLRGYESVRPLSAVEAAALVPMTALCHAEFALTEADYFAGVLAQERNVRVCTDGYLVGHARWYRGPGGARLMAWLRRWAERHEVGKERYEECEV